MNVYLHTTRCISQYVVLHETVQNYFPVLRAEDCFLSMPSGLAHGNAYHFVRSPTDSCLTAWSSSQFFLWQLIQEVEQSVCAVICRSWNKCLGKIECICRFCLIQGNRWRIQHSLVYLNSTCCSTRFWKALWSLGTGRMKQSFYQSSLSKNHTLPQQKLYMKSWQY